MSNGRTALQFVKPNRKSAFITLLLSYLFILLLPVCIGIVLYEKVESIMTNNANRSNLAMMEQLKQVADNRLMEVGQMAQQIAFNPRLQSLLIGGYSDDLPNQYKYSEFINELARYKNVSTFISNLYVYLEAGDHILTPAMKTSSGMFYSNFNSYEGMDEKEWKRQFFETYHMRSYFPVRPLLEEGKWKNVITFVQSLPMDSRTEVRGALVITLDEQQFRGMLDKIEWVNQGAVYILNEKNEVVLSTAGNTEQIVSMIPKLTEQSGLLDWKSEGHQQMVSYASSDMNGWKYVSVVPRDVVLQPVNRLKAWALTALALCLIGGAFASWLMAFRNYSPVRDLVNVILKDKRIAGRKVANEFDFIKETVLSSFHTERDLREEISRQSPVIRANFLSRFIRGYVDSAAVTPGSLEFMGIRFASDRFRVIVIDINDCSKFIKGDTEREWALVRFVIANIANDLLKQRGYIVELDRNRLGILIHDEEKSPGNDTESVDQWVSGIKNTVESRFHTSITIAVSNVHEGPDAAGRCYREAMEALDYKVVKGPNSILYYEETKWKGPHSYYYPVEMEAQLMNVTKSGDYNQVETLLNSLYETNIVSDRLTPELGKCLFFDIAGTMLKTLNSLSIEYETVFQDGSAPISQLADCGTMEDMHTETKRLYKAACDYIKSGSRGHRDRLLTGITEYIDQSYHDGMLSLVSISEKFSITPQYLSTFFKKQSGQNITDYIAKVRVAQAKRLMRDRSLNLSQIALMVGYANDIGFIRVFKKLEGITPGKYRDQMISQEEGHLIPQ